MKTTGDPGTSPGYFGTSGRRKVNRLERSATQEMGTFTTFIVTVAAVVLDIPALGRALQGPCPRHPTSVIRSQWQWWHRMTAPNFIPSNEQLGKLDRDLRFHPSTNEHPIALTREQVTAFNRDGYLAGIRIFNEQEIIGIRNYFDTLLANTLASGGDSYSISSAHLRYRRVYDILTDARIVACVRDLIGEDTVAWGSHFFCKLPGDGKRVSWHQDASYWPLTPSMAITVWLAIDDAKVENACMRYIPGTHRLGHLTYSLSENDETNVLNQTVPGAESFGKPVDVELSAGQISIHSDLLLHGSEMNTSSKRRCGLTLRYCPAIVRAGLGWNAKGVVVEREGRSRSLGQPTTAA